MCKSSDIREQSDDNIILFQAMKILHGGSKPKIKMTDKATKIS
jgi:hypothetical protein